MEGFMLLDVYLLLSFRYAFEANHAQVIILVT